MTDLAHALALAESAVEDCMPDGTPWRTLDPTVRAQAAIEQVLRNKEKWARQALEGSQG